MQRPIVEGSSEPGQFVDRDGRGLVCASAHDEIGTHQTGERLAERFVLHGADGLAEFTTATRAITERSENNAIPPMAKNIGGRSQQAVGNPTAALPRTIFHVSILVRAPAPFGNTAVPSVERMTFTTRFAGTTRRIAVVGTGNVAYALGALWAARGHTITIGARSTDKARSLAAKLGRGATPFGVREAVDGADVVLLAVPWTGIEDVLTQIDAPAGVLAGATIIDPTNPVDHGVGRHLLSTGSVAERIASHAPGAHVVKAFNVHPATYWNQATTRDVVTIAGSDAGALDAVSALVRDIGATPHALGGLERSRQLEELGATVIALAFAGIEPRSAVPRV